MSNVVTPASAPVSSLIVRFMIGGKEVYSPGYQGATGPLCWGTNSSGNVVWAFSQEKASLLRAKVARYVPQRWETFRDAAGNTASPVGAAAPKPAPKSAPKAAPAKPPAEPGVRSAAQCRVTLALMVRNFARCESGQIGGDLAKYDRAIGTAYRSFVEALVREGASTSVAVEAADAVCREARVLAAAA